MGKWLIDRVLPGLVGAAIFAAIGLATNWFGQGISTLGQQWVPSNALLLVGMRGQDQCPDDWEELGRIAVAADRRGELDWQSYVEMDPDGPQDRAIQITNNEGWIEIFPTVCRRSE